MDRGTAQELASATDEELMALLLRRQEAALGTIYDRYVRLVYAVALRITGDRETAEEVVQDVFQNVWQAAGSFQPGVGSFWFYEGTTLGYRGVFAYYPKDDLVVAVALNSQPPEGTDAIGPLFEALYAAVMQ